MQRTYAQYSVGTRRKPSDFENEEDYHVVSDILFDYMSGNTITLLALDMRGKNPEITRSTPNPDANILL